MNINNNAAYAYIQMQHKGHHLKFKCENCCQYGLISLPSSIDLLITMMETWLKSHKECEALALRRKGE